MNYKETYLEKINTNDPFFDIIKEEYPRFDKFLEANKYKKCLVLEDPNSTNIQAFCFTDFITERIKTGVNTSIPGDKRLVVRFMYTNDIGYIDSIIENYIMRNANLSRVNEILVYIHRKRRDMITMFKRHKFKVKYTDENNFNMLFKPLKG